MKKNSTTPLLLATLLLLFNLIKSAHQQEQINETATTADDTNDSDDDDCAFISGQHCDQNGICKYCAMCLQSSCILSKTINNNNSLSLQQPTSSCNTTQFGTTNLYNWYDYCLSSDNDSTGDYCSTSTECYQYRKSAGPSVTYAWNNLTCNPNTCILTVSNGSPPPIPLPPIENNNMTTTKNQGSDTANNEEENNNAATNAANADGSRRHYYHHPLRSPAAIALTVVCALVILVAFVWFIRYCRKRSIWPFGSIFPAASITSSGKESRTRQQQVQSISSITSSIPSSAPPSFSSIPPDMAMIRHPHLHLYNRGPSIHSTRSSSSLEPLPSYLSPYPTPPKYEQAIVTQIRDLRRTSEEASYDHYAAASLPSMWVPVFFTTPQQQNRRGGGGGGGGDVFGFAAPSHTFWLQQQSLSSGGSQMQQQQQQQQQQNDHPSTTSSNAIALFNNNNGSNVDNNESNQQHQQRPNASS